MTQLRVYDFGATLTQGRTKTLASKLFLPGVYEGFDLSLVTVSELVLTSGAFLLGSGVLIEETDVTTVTPPNPAAATNYTLVADHDDVQAVGGSKVVYNWYEGLLDRSGDPNTSSIALVWLRHPGAASITSSMLSFPAKIKAGAWAVESSTGWLQAPFAQACSVANQANITAVGSTHSSGGQHLGLLVTNSALVGLQTHQFRLPLPAVPRARYIDVYADIPNLGSISFGTGAYEMVDAAGGTISTSPASVSGPVTGLDTPAATIEIESTEEAPVTLGVTVTVPALTSGVFLKGFRVRGD